MFKLARMAMVMTALSSVALVTSHAAAEVCNEWNKTKCQTAGASAAASTGSGVYALLKYRQAKGFEKANTKVVADFSGGPQALSEGRLDSLSTGIQEGDKVTIVYNLSESANRQYHINLMESQARASRQLADSYRLQAASALMPRTETVQEPVYEYVPDGNGGVSQVIKGYTTRTVVHPPDFAAASSYTNLASSAESDAAEYVSKAHAARMGGPVPIYDLEKVVGADSDTVRLTKSFVKEQVSAQGKIKLISRLPASAFGQLKSMVFKARAGLVGVGVGAALAFEELLTGKVAEKIEKSNENDSAYGSSFRRYRGSGYAQ